MIFLEIIQIEGFNLLSMQKVWQRMKAWIELMKADQHGAGVVTFCHLETTWGASHRLQGSSIKSDSIIPCQLWINSFTEQLKDLMSAVKKQRHPLIFLVSCLLIQILDFLLYIVVWNFCRQCKELYQTVHQWQPKIMRLSKYKLAYEWVYCSYLSENRYGEGISKRQHHSKTHLIEGNDSQQL